MKKDDREFWEIQKNIDRISKQTDRLFLAAAIMGTLALILFGLRIWYEYHTSNP